MSEFLQRFEKVAVSRRLLPARGKVLVAVSGGVDSMVLLHALLMQNRWSLHVAHFNHQLRGRDSDADEQLVRRTAKALGLPVTVGRKNVQSFARAQKISLEMAARQLRHEFLAHTARAKKTHVIALAHHADDQVELFFLRLLRGAGGEGAGGMKRRGPSFVDKKLALVRPLLDFSKAELQAFAAAAQIPFREDASNHTGDFLRNRIRNELLPLLREKYQPGLDQTVLRLMDITGAESEFAGHIARHWFSHAGHESDEFSNLPVAIQRRVLLAQLADAGHQADFELVEQLRASPDTFISLSPDLSVIRNPGGRLKFKRIVAAEFSDAEMVVDLRGRSGKLNFAGRPISWSVKKSGKFRLPPKQAGREFFDADKIGGRIILRHWRAGDRFQPVGLASAARLQNLFVNAKIPADQRRRLVLATTADGAIFWVQGLRIGESFKLTLQTRRQLVWQTKASP